MKRACAAHEGVVEQVVARKGHSLEVTGSSPVYATKVFSWFVLSAPEPRQPSACREASTRRFLRLKRWAPGDLPGAIAMTYSTV